VATQIRDLMTTNVVTLDAQSPVSEAARKMRDAGVGDVLVTKDGRPCGIVTDRDIVVRCLAEDQDPKQAKLESLCSSDLVTIGPDVPEHEAVELMKQKAIRRIPVMHGDQVVGIVSIGDLAQHRDRESALGEISAAPPNQ